MDAEKMQLIRPICPHGWFAAGSYVQKAMNLLSDGAFRVFVYLCLNARPDSGVLECSLTQLAKKECLQKPRHIQELFNRN